MRHIALLVFPAVLAAQSVPPIRLGPVDARLSHDFTSITSLRELSDGRLLVTDGREQRFLVVDFRADTVHQVGRIGPGPTEYPYVGFVRSIGGDSSIMTLVGAPWRLLFGDKIVGSVAPDDRGFRATGGLSQGFDQHGGSMRIREKAIKNGRNVLTPQDSHVVVITHRGTGRSDTVARLRRRAVRYEAEVDAEGKVMSLRGLGVGVLQPVELAALARDGWLGIARVEPFRVDWRDLNGQWIHGPPLPVALTPIDAAERRAVVARAGGPNSVPADDAWPKVLPPFADNAWAAFTTPEGKLVLRRHPSARHPGNRYFVIDRAAKLVGEIVLAQNETIVGFGEQSVYTLVANDDDLLRLRRRAWQ